MRFATRSPQPGTFLPADAGPTRICAHYIQAFGCHVMRRAQPARWLGASVLLATGLLAQSTRPVDPGVGILPIVPPGPGIPAQPIVPPGGGLPGQPIIPPGGGGTPATQPIIVAPSGALVGSTVSASILLGQTGAGSSGVTGITYQWSINGGRITSDSRGASIQFVTDVPGTVTLQVNIGIGGAWYSPTSSITVVSAELAGSVTAPATVAANATSVAASVPAAQNNDRTFRWNIIGGGSIVSGQGTRTITWRPTSPGLKEVICQVNIQNVVTVPIRAFVVAQGTGSPASVSVSGGSGSGTYPAGTPLTIIADPPSPGQVFDRWIGTTDLLGTDPLAARQTHVALAVPAAGVSLAATYRVAPVWDPTVVANFNPQAQSVATSSAPGTSGAPRTQRMVATTLAYHIPADPSGLVFILHAGGSSLREWFERPQQILLVRDLVAAGYGVAALDSLDRSSGSWSMSATLANNPDALNHLAALDHLVTRGAISANLPIFFLGNTAGANAAARYADLLNAATPNRPIRGTVLYLATGIDTLAVTSRVPQFFVLAANDSAVGNSGMQDVREAAQLFLGRGISTGIVTTNLTPVHAGRFRNLALATSATSPAFSDDDARVIFDTLVNAGYLDANHYPRSVPKAAALAGVLPAALRARASDIAAEIAVAAAEREFSSNANAQVISFLNDRAGNSSGPAPGRLVNLSTRGYVAHLTDSLTVGFTLTGPERATLLIRGVGPTLARFRVEEPLAAARLEIYRGNTLLAAIEGWDDGIGPARRAQVAAAATAVGAFPLNNASLDSAIVLDLEAGSYTATLKGIGGAVGETLAEIYDVSRNRTRLSNLSTLSRISRDGDLLVPGIVVAGNNPSTIVMRAVSQGLTRFGLPPGLVLGDARLTVRSGTQIVATNNSWAQTDASRLSAAFPVVGAFPLTDASDAALLSPLAPGAYTLQAGATAAAVPGSTAPNQTGAVLVEVYEVR